MNLAVSKATSNLNASNEKVLAIGNRLANLNTYSNKKSDMMEPLSNSHEALESLLQPTQSNSFKKKPYSAHSLHVDSAVSISGVSQQSNSAVPSPTPPTSSLPTLPPRDDAQMVDFVSSFLFPIIFIIFK